MKQEYQKAIQLIKEKNISFRHATERPDKLIRLAEETLSVKFPVSYVHFLRDYGYASFGGMEIYGIIDEDFINSSVPDAIWLNIANRKDFSQPNHIIVIAGTGDGSSYALDLSQMNAEDECPIVMWPLNGYEDNSPLEIVAPDFGTWFLEKVEEQIK